MKIRVFTIPLSINPPICVAGYVYYALLISLFPLHPPSPFAKLNISFAHLSSISTTLIKAQFTLAFLKQANSNLLFILDGQNSKKFKNYLRYIGNLFYICGAL
ncbi:MAG: hypothetical protein AAGD05_10160, partial [Bacteroidota bacterium]